MSVHQHAQHRASADSADEAAAPAVTRPVRWLSMHVPYGCRHAGACCSSGWDIPLERSRVAAVGMLRADGTWLRPAPGAPAEIGGLLAHSNTGHCVFHGDGCEIHRRLGHEAMPSACQHFPRECLIDARGVSVTLSHYCPTAANLLFDHEGPVEIVDGPPVLPSGEAEGLDARGVLPPLLSADVLMDYQGYTAWEAHSIRVLTADDDRSPESAIATLESQVSQLQRWRPGNESLVERIATFGDEKCPESQIGPGPISRGRAASEIGAGLISELVIRRYLAAHAFASWLAYQGGGIGAVVAGLHLALGVLRAEIARQSPDAGAPITRARLHASIRQADLRLRHLADRDRLAQEAAREYRNRQ